MNRRSFLLGLCAVAAPAVIRTPGLLMPVRVVERDIRADVDAILAEWAQIYADQITEVLCYGHSALDLRPGLRSPLEVPWLLEAAAPPFMDRVQFGWEPSAG